MKKVQIAWVKVGFFNILEHGSTRVWEALTTLLLILGLPTHLFAELAFTQAIATAFLVFFISPADAIFKHFSKWKHEGPAFFSARLKTFRFYGRSLIGISLILSFCLAFIHSNWSWSSDRFWGIFRGFLVNFYGISCGVDREFLRVDLHLRALNVFTFLQKFLLFTGCALAIWLSPNGLAGITCAVIISTVVTAISMEVWVNKLLLNQRASTQALSEKKLPSHWDTLKTGVRDFSLWPHLVAYVWIWIQNLDVFFLGFFRHSPQVIGLYAACLKLANLSLVLPQAFKDIFAIWLGRSSNKDLKNEQRVLFKSSFGLVLFCFVQALIFYKLSPWIISSLSRGRWGETDQIQMIIWLKWFLIAAIFLSLTFLFSTWLILRANVIELLFKTYVPWLVCATTIYSIICYNSNAEWLAISNISVAMILLGLLIYRYYKSRKI